MSSILNLFILIRKNFLNTIGEKIKYIRQDKGLTQAEFGQNIGLSKQAVSNVENNLSNPSIDFIGKLIVYYNINSNWLIANLGEPYNAVKNLSSREEILKDIENILIKRGI